MDNKLVIFEEEMAICYMLDRRKAKNAMNELSKKIARWSNGKTETGGN